MKKKIFYILNSIDNKSQITETGKYIKVNRYGNQNKFFQEISEKQLENILKLLEREKVIKVIKKAEQFNVVASIISGLVENRDIFCFFDQVLIQLPGSPF